jgi:hypothetical protein
LGDGEALERFRSGAEVEIVEVGVAAVAREFGGSGIDDDDVAGVRDGNGAEDQRVGEAEDSDVGTDAEGEREYDDNRKARIFSDVAEGETQVAEKHFEVMAGANVAHVFFHLLDAAEFDLCAAAGCGGSEAVGAIFVGEQIGVGAKFGVEIGLGAFAMKEVALEACEA